MNFEIFELRGTKNGSFLGTGPPKSAESEIVLKLEQHEYEEEIQNNLYKRTLQLYFLRMSSVRKLELITNMCLQIRSRNSLSTLLYIFSSVNTKLVSYSKVTADSNCLFDQYIFDHDRMLDSATLNETISDDLEWFSTLDDSDQIDVITTLMRLAGNNIIKKMYWRIIKIFNERKFSAPQATLKKYESNTSMFFPEDTGDGLITLKIYESNYSEQEEEVDYNPDCPLHKKIIEGRKQWAAQISKIKKEIETELQKINEPALQRLKQKEMLLNSIFERGSSRRKDDTFIKSPRTNENDIDWVQLLPIWTVKKIFYYLDEKNLQNLKNVNNYWAVISREVIAEKKARIMLQSTIKKSEEFLDNLLGIPLSKEDLKIYKEKIITEATVFKKRIEKQRRTGAALRKYEQDPESLHNRCMISECYNLLESEHAPILSQLKPFPTGVPFKMETAEKSITMTETSFRDGKSEFTSDIKTPPLPREDNYFPRASIVSLVPSIVVTDENMETW